MSGVVKDDPNPNAAGGETPVEDAVQAEAATPAADSDSKAARRSAPHLRVVGAEDVGELHPSTDEETVAETDIPPHQRIGAVIKAARENQGLTLEQVSKITKIHLSHLRAVEDMTPSLLGAPVYAKGYIKNYAKHLKLDADLILKRYLAECAILSDPVKQDIEPPVSTRKLRSTAPLLGLVIVGLVAAGGFLVFSGNEGKKPVAAADSTGDVASAPVTTAGGVAAAPAVRPVLRIVALKAARLEVRSADGDKFVSKDVEAGYTYVPRVGAGWTVTTNDGTAFEWRLGDQSLGVFASEPGWVYAQSVDLAASRPPIVVEAPPVTDVPPTGAPVAATPGAAPNAIAPAAPNAAAPAAPKPPRPRPAAQAPAPDPSVTAEAVQPPASSTPPPSAAIAPPTPASDVSSQAYPSN